MVGNDAFGRRLSRGFQMNHGGRREGAGRPQGSTNRATKEQGARLSELARLHTEMALDTLVDIASNGKNENARIAAATAILDRGYGRAAPTPLKELKILSITFDFASSVCNPF